MHCPHCGTTLRERRPATRPGRCRLSGHHGEMEMDHGQFAALVANALAYGRQRRRLARALNDLERYREVAGRMARDPDFARYVLAYDGDGGQSLFPLATRETTVADIKARLARGEGRDSDLARYLALDWRE